MSKLISRGIRVSFLINLHFFIPFNDLYGAKNARHASIIQDM